MISTKTVIIMGGIGSGRYWRHGANETTDSYRSIDIRRWQHDGLLKTGHSFIWQWIREVEVVSSIKVSVEVNHVILSYSHRVGNGQATNMDYAIVVDRTSCHLGGKRPWFCCPASGCNKRAAILYCGGIFACRRCHRLAYPSQRERFGDRATKQADKIRNRLGWELGILNGEGLKPKGMHWKTFERLRIKHRRLVNLSFIDAKLRFGINFNKNDLRNQIKKRAK